LIPSLSAVIVNGPVPNGFAAYVVGGPVWSKPVVSTAAAVGCPPLSGRSFVMFQPLQALWQVGWSPVWPVIPSGSDGAETVAVPPGVPAAADPGAVVTAVGVVAVDRVWAMLSSWATAWNSCWEDGA